MFTTGGKDTKFKGFKEINWLNINGRFLKCVLSSIYKLFNSERPEYFTEIYFHAEPSKIHTWTSFQRLKQPLRKSNKGLKSASYSSPLLWNKLKIEIKRSGSTSFEHNLKNHYLTKMGHTSLLISSWSVGMRIFMFCLFCFF